MARSGTRRPCSSRTSRSNAFRFVRVEPVDVVAERPALGAGRPDAIAHAAHRHVAIVGASQHLVDRSPARGEHAARQRLRRRAGLGPGERGREGHRSQRGRDQEDTAADRWAERFMSRWFPSFQSAPGVDTGRTSRGRRGEASDAGRLGSSLVPPDQRRAGAEGMLLLAMADTAAHPALLAPDFATSFTSSTTGHAFSSGVSGDRESGSSETRPNASGVDQRADSIRKSIESSRPTCSIRPAPRSGSREDTIDRSR